MATPTQESTHDGMGAGLKIIAFSQPVGGTGSVSGAAVAGDSTNSSITRRQQPLMEQQLSPHTVVDNPRVCDPPPP